MSRIRPSFGQKVLSTSAVVILLLCAPLQLAAKESASPAADRSSVFAWFSGLWNDLTAWLTGEVVHTPPSNPGSFVDGRCTVDPNGCPGG